MVDHFRRNKAGRIEGEAHDTVRLKGKVLGALSFPFRSVVKPHVKKAG